MSMSFKTWGYLFFIIIFLHILVHGSPEQKGDPSSIKSPSQQILSSLSVEDKQALELFFRTLFRDSWGGYVVYGEKPVCIEAIPLEAESIPEHHIGAVASQRHQFGINVKKGLRVWKNLPVKSRNFMIQISDQSVYNGMDLVIVNRKAFIQAVSDNLALFQYALGPNITPEGLLSKLNSREPFSAVLKHDKVLFGILLGYGVHNALKASRVEYVDDCLAEPQSVLPLKSSLAKASLAKAKIAPRLDKSAFYRSLSGDPSFGFTSLNEEKQILSSGSRLSLEECSVADPLIPWFGCWKSQETDSLLKSYRLAQEKIKAVLASDHFLEEVLQRVFDERD